MTELLQRAIDKVQALPEDEQDRVAVLILGELEAANGQGIQKEEQTDDRPIWEKLRERAKNVPDEEWEKFPKDGAAELDHYLYGTPKRNS